MATDPKTARAETDAPDVPPVAEKHSEEIDESYVSVTHGYGKVRPSDRHQIDGHWFVNGIARHVPLELAKEWKKLPFGKSFMIHPSEASEVQIAQRCGVQPMKPQKLAVQMAGSDLHAVADEMDPETLERVILDLTQHLPSTHYLRARERRGRF